MQPADRNDGESQQSSYGQSPTNLSRHRVDDDAKELRIHDGPLLDVLNKAFKVSKERHRRDCVGLQCLQTIPDTQHATDRTNVTIMLAANSELRQSYGRQFSIVEAQK